MIAISDAITSISIALGYPPLNSSACYVQGFLSLFFGRASWYFTDVLIIQLYNIVVFRKFYLTEWHMHFIVWTINITLQILPYTTGSYYGRSFDDDKDIPVLRCVITHSTDVANALFWNNFVMNAQLVMSFIIIVGFTIIILVYSCYVDKSNSILREHIRDTSSTAMLYPLSMLITYVPSTITGFVVNSHIDKYGHPPYHGMVIVNYFLASNALYGLFLSLIFYFKTKEAYHEWLKIFQSIFYRAATQDDVNPSINTSEVLMNPLTITNESINRI